MDLKDYRVPPDEGLFEKIHGSLRRRRLMRMGGTATALVAVVAVACLLLWPAGENEGGDVARLVREVPDSNHSVNATVEPTASADEAYPLPMDESASHAETPLMEPASQTDMTASMPSAVNESSDAASKPDMVAVVPTYNHVVAHLTLPSEPQQELKWICPNDGAGIVRSEPTEEEHEPMASSETKPAAKSGELPLHEDNLIWAPNVIVPSGDVDDNRVFKLRYTSEVTKFQIYIYNRGGRLVFNSDDPSFVWDGTSRGTALPQGAYVWVAKFRDASGRAREEHGTVTIVR